MKVQIEVDTDNAAFEDNGLREYDTILKAAAMKAYTLATSGECDSLLRDSNGNTVGRVHVGQEDTLNKKARQAEKRKWFEKVKSKEFWKGLVDGVDGEDGVEYATDVYVILDDLLGPRG